MSTEAELPGYKCHKEVRALKILSVCDNMIIPEQGFSPFEVSREYLEKHKPEADGYYVRYEDGYESFSPATAFESGYTRVPSDWRARLLEERRELDVKRDKLTEFLKSETYRNLDIVDRDLLLTQHGLMERYSGVLAQLLQR